MLNVGQGEAIRSFGSRFIPDGETGVYEGPSCADCGEKVRINTEVIIQKGINFDCESISHSSCRYKWDFKYLFIPFKRLKERCPNSECDNRGGNHYAYSLELSYKERVKPNLGFVFSREFQRKAVKNSIQWALFILLVGGGLAYYLCNKEVEKMQNKIDEIYGPRGTKAGCLKGQNKSYEIGCRVAESLQKCDDHECKIIAYQNIKALNCSAKLNPSLGNFGFL